MARYLVVPSFRLHNVSILSQTCSGSCCESPPCTAVIQCTVRSIQVSGIGTSGQKRVRTGMRVGRRWKQAGAKATEPDVGRLEGLVIVTGVCNED